MSACDRWAAKAAIGRFLPVEIEVMIGDMIPPTWTLPSFAELYTAEYNAPFERRRAERRERVKERG